MCFDFIFYRFKHTYDNSLGNFLKMGRKPKLTVDYFPHYIGDGKKIHIVESNFGNDGYAVWFKLLEVLAKTEGHFINMNDDVQVMYMSSKCNVNEDDLFKILDLLARLKQIDGELWHKKRIIWSERFIASIKEVYLKRRREVPCSPREFLPQPGVFSGQKWDFRGRNAVSGVENRQTKLNKIKLNKIKPDEIMSTNNAHAREVDRNDHEFSNSGWAKPTYEDVERAFRECLNQMALPANVFGSVDELARNFYDHYEGQGWVRGNGQKIHNFKSVVSTWITGEKKKSQSRSNYNVNEKRKRSWE